jgi:hypothetical protein
MAGGHEQRLSYGSTSSIRLAHPRDRWHPDRGSHSSADPPDDGLMAPSSATWRAHIGPSTGRGELPSLIGQAIEPRPRFTGPSNHPPAKPHNCGNRTSFRYRAWTTPSAILRSSSNRAPWLQLVGARWSAEPRIWGRCLGFGEGVDNVTLPTPSGTSGSSAARRARQHDRPRGPRSGRTGQHVRHDPGQRLRRQPRADVGWKQNAGPRSLHPKS